MPMWFGVGSAGQLIFGLPGNPVSTLVCLLRYAWPAIAAMSGAAVAAERVPLAAPAKTNRSLTVFMPVVLQHEVPGQALAAPRPTLGSGDFLALAGTDGFVELPPREDPAPAGFVASLWRW